MKRHLTSGGGVSPPSTKRKIESTVTSQAVENFFAPASAKKAEAVVWRVEHGTLLVGHYKDEGVERATKRQKIAAFDFDSTLIQTSSGNVFGKNARDWRWLDGRVPTRLRSLYKEGYRVVILSNQGGLKLGGLKDTLKKDAEKLSTFKDKVGYVLNQLDIPISIYAATGKDHYRKPRVGMWEDLLDHCDLDESIGPDLAQSFFVGDAAGRMASKGYKADHSSGDRNFAANVGIGFHTPEEYFLASAPREWKRSFDPLAYRAVGGPEGTTPFKKRNDLDIVLLCGSPGSGKSTYFRTTLKPLGYERVNQDILKSRDKCLQAAADHLANGRSVAVDNTNADTQTREKWIQRARASNVPIRCILLETPAEACRHNDAVRALHAGHADFNPEHRDMLPLMAFTGYQSRYREPQAEEGFQDIIRVAFQFQGDDEQWKLWSKYWT